MRYTPWLVVLVLCTPSVVSAQYEKYSIVKIKSHGVSAVTVSSSPGGSYLLTCAHGFSPSSNPMPKTHHRVSSKLLHRKMTFTFFTPNPGPKKKIRYKILAIDGRRDLCLIWLSVQLPYAAKLGNQQGRDVLSAGFDHMKAARFQNTSVLRVSPLWITTRMSPRPGRSGGPLFNSKGEVIGTCVGVDWGGGLYTSPSSIQEFISTAVTATPLFDSAAQQPVTINVQQPFRRQYYTRPTAPC